MSFARSQRLPSLESGSCGHLSTRSRPSSRPTSAGSTRTARSQPSGSTPLRITARLAQPKQLKRPPPVHVWNHLEKTSFVPPEEAYCTQVATDSPSCSVPPKLLELLQNMWRDSVARGRRYVCILEVCHNCEDHRRTTKHNPEKYKAYTENVARLVAQEFSFMTVEQMHHSRHYGCCKRLARRLGAFEVYLLAPEPGTNNQICTPYLLHSKLTSLTWPNNQQVKHRCLGALPGIVTRILQLPLQDFSVAEGLEVMKEAKALGLDSWEALDGLADRVSSANRALESGQQAAAQKDKKALREAIQECQELQLADEAIEGWMQDLKQSNMALFNIKRQAKRFQRNAAFSAAARRLEGAVQAPLRVEQLKVAIAKAQQAELPEEDIRAALALAARAEAAVQRVAAGFRQRCLLEVAGAIDDIVQLALQDSALSEAQGTLSLLSQKGACAAQQRDLVELQEVLGAWQIEAGEGGTASGPEYQAILQAEMVRANLAKQVEEAERRFQAQRWDALQSAVERLKDAHIQDAQWERWTSALQREKQWTVLRAVSGAAVSLKRQLYKRRLEAVLHADQVSLKQLDEAADAAEAQQVDGSLVTKARAEASTARQRWSDAQDAMAKKLVDRADVMIWKLQKGRVRLEELTRRQGALWDLVDALQDAENSQDWQAMDRAVAGWKEERPGIEHEAFASETSATRLLRRARDRRGELRLKELRQEVNDILNSLKDPMAQISAAEAKAELQRAAKAVREMLKLGWEMTPARNARLLMALQKAEAESGRQVTLARFCAALLQMLEGRPQVVFVLDVSGAKGSCEDELNSAVTSLARCFSKHTSGASFSVVGYSPAEVLQEPGEVTALEPTLARAAGAAAAAKPQAGQALREAKKLLRQDKGEDRPQAVLHITVAPESSKEAQKAMKVLDALGTTVLGLGIGSVKVDSLMKLSSPGLAFKVDASQVQSFLQDAQQEVERILEASQAQDPEEILKLLDGP